VVSPTVAARLAFIAAYAAVGAYLPYLPIYFRSLGFGLDTVGWLAALGAAAGLVGAPLWGAAADRFSRSRLVLPAAAGLAALGAGWLSAVTELPLVVPAAFVMAMAFAGIPPGLDARALGIYRGDRNRYGQLRLWGSASYIVVVLLTGAVTERAGAGSLFALLVPSLLITALIVLALPPDARVEPAMPRLSGIWAVMRQPALRRFLLAALLVWSANSAINQYFSIHLLALGAPADLVGVAWAIGALVEIPIMWSYPRLASRVGAERLLIVGAAAFVLRGVMLALSPDPILGTLTMLLHGVGFSLMLVGGVTYVSRHAPGGTAATAQGVHAAVAFSLTMIIGPGLAGFAARSFGLPGTFALAAAAGAGAVLVLGMSIGWRAVPGLEPSRG
jgi:PPP family 3-phenylpropionic acid transporter